MAREFPLSEEAQEYADRMFKCEPPCDSYGVCDPCIERACFEAGYGFGVLAERERSRRLYRGINEAYADLEEGDPEHARKVLVALLNAEYREADDAARAESDE